MADYRAEARRAAERHGLNPVLFVRQIGAESNFNPKAKSGAGAQGIAQIMPATAKAWAVDPHDPVAALNAAAEAMAKYVRSYGSYRNALVAYNAGPGAVGKPLYKETAAYIKKILHGHGDGGSAAAPKDSKAYRTETVPGEMVTDKLGALRASLLEGNKNVLLRANALLQSGLYTTQAPDRQRKVADQFSGTAPSGRGAGHPGVIVRPGANRKGVGLSSAILQQVQAVSEVFGGKLTIGTGTNHNRLTTSGNVSDHWSGNGADIPALGKRLTRLGQAALIAAGMPEKQARKTKGGAFTLHKGGKRIQVIFNSNVGGNHYNHLHVGVG